MCLVLGFTSELIRLGYLAMKIHQAVQSSDPFWMLIILQWKVFYKSREKEALFFSSVSVFSVYNIALFYPIMYIFSWKNEVVLLLTDKIPIQAVPHYIHLVLYNRGREYKLFNSDISFHFWNKNQKVQI